MVSSSALPSLATVVDLFRLRPGRNLDCLGFDSVFGVGRPSAPSDVWLPPLLIRKKFFSLVEVGVCVPEASPFECFFENDNEEKLRFSDAILQYAKSMDPQMRAYGSERI